MTDKTLSKRMKDKYVAKPTPANDKFNADLVKMNNSIRIYKKGDLVHINESDWRIVRVSYKRNFVQTVSENDKTKERLLPLAQLNKFPVARFVMINIPESWGGEI